MSQVRPIARSDLRNILKGGATSRILDLHSIALRHAGQEAHGEAPFFLHPRLNQAFIVKHTVRAHERPYVMSNQPVVTKVLVPLARDDLSLGGHAVFVEEIGFAAKMRSLFERPDDPHLLDLDLTRLRELAVLPSFDPFLLAERYRENSRPIAPLYFDISAEEIARMEKTVAEQIVSVVSLAFGSGRSGQDEQRALRFAQSLLSNESEGRLSALRQSLDMTLPEFKAGMFGWKGILYYRWSMSEAFANLKHFLQQIKTASIVGATESERRDIEYMRRQIIEETRARWSSLSSVMDEYDQVFTRFSSGQDTNSFKRFLLRAPMCFLNLGHDLSVIGHVPGYWNFWEKQNKRGYLHAREALPMFANFVLSITRHAPGSDALTVPALRRHALPLIQQPPDLVVASTI
ncbi:hypothetical protein [uncultured Maricaulis sp.]|uniref:hypothetical protein n=1 Tax=uncultured Maricaulis sp. TaxID=174710 RepID=UPI0030DD165F